MHPSHLQGFGGGSPFVPSSRRVPKSALARQAEERRVLHGARQKQAIHHLPGLHLDQISTDFMHCGPLGTQPLACGATLVELAREGMFGNHDEHTRWAERLDHQLKNAHTQLSSWMKSRGYSATVSELCCAALSMAAQTYRPLLKCKARACAYVTEWLSERTALHAIDRLGKLRVAWLWGYRELWKRFTVVGVFLNSCELETMHVAVRAVVRSRNALAPHARSVQSCAWPRTPKHHQLPRM